ncbi:tRNA (guanosine(37)-N1)-methyltransferase TrmD [Helicobacter heilmannii]|uniref:tRNA (guanosine(37)-N1)-methyltransferase TrmD n=1 Tax=Helicobacter heilmannii TaxID=35817 RepID=UPI002553B20C|nr:tRNA (guanosine(37)-N1)-methyltransferase TrmD [Helicobacter heilmannii]
MHFSILSLFPNLLSFYFEDSILKRARAQGIFSLDLVDMRPFSPHKFKRADFPLVGGGAGQILDPYMVENALESLDGGHVIFLSPVGKPYTQQDAQRLATYKHLILVCGRYDGFDERLIETHADEVFSVGDFVLTGGELPALCVCDSVARLLKGTLGNVHSLEKESFSQHLLEAPNFANTYNLAKKPSCTQLATISAYSKGNHAKIEKIMHDLSIQRTKYFRPPLYCLDRSLQKFCQNNKKGSSK